MFRRVGRTIKVVSQIFMWIGILYFIFLGVALITDPTILLTVDLTPELNSMLYKLTDQELALFSATTGIVLLVVGILFSWLSTLFLYGFGQLIDNSDKLVSKKDTALCDNETLEAKEARNVRYVDDMEVKVSDKPVSQAKLKKWLKAGLITKKEYHMLSTR